MGDGEKGLLPSASYGVLVEQTQGLSICILYCIANEVRQFQL